MTLADPMKLAHGNWNWRGIRAAIAVAWVALIALPVPAQLPTDRAGVLAISGGTIIDVRNGQHVRDGVVVVEGDHIVGVGRAADVRIPRGAQVLDASGKWILPGLFDMHVHGSSRPDVPLELYVVNGVTSVRDLGGNLTALRLTRQALEAGKRRGPRLFFAGPILDGDRPFAPSMSIIADTPGRGAGAVDFLAGQGVDSIKIYNGITEPVLEAIIETAHRHGLPVVGHVPREITAARAAEMGLDVIEHTPIRSQDLRDWGLLAPEDAERIAALGSVTEREARVWERVDLAAPQIQALIARFVEDGVFLDPTLSIDEYDSLFLYEQEAEHPHNRYLASSFVAEALGPQHEALFRTPAQLREVVVAGLEKRARFIAMCARAGVRIVAGTDGPGIGRLTPGFGLHHELELLVQAGLSPLDAIRAATLYAALALRQDAKLGTIEEGKLADLVVLDADPLADIRNTRRISSVVSRGRLLDRASLDGILDQVETDQRARR